jgi:16S rRNA (adenine1518-N6/adenine1519-N6)-dimethyltransferase
MNRSEMRRWLDERNLRLTKSLGQNFLHDANQLSRIVEAAELLPTDKVLEIGPGLGPLTERLLAGAGQVLAIEKDARLVGGLLERFGGHPRLQVVQADALNWLRTQNAEWNEWKLVANLPYSVASPILVELADRKDCPGRIVVTLQLEVARRLVAGPDADDYGVLSLLVQSRYESGGIFRIPPGSFFPEPGVDSACVTLRRRGIELLDAGKRDAFKRLVKQAFSQRRKMMFKLLKQHWPVERLTDAFARTGIDERIRAERVGLEQFVALAGELS